MLGALGRPRRRLLRQGLRIAFLGRPRSAAAAEAREVGAAMKGAMVALAALCVAVGIVRGLVIGLASTVARQLFPSAAMPFETVEACSGWCRSAAAESS